MMSPIYFVLMLGGLIFFHEFGHFIIARLFGVRVLEFSIGFGPKIGSFQRGDTVYRIGLLPLGGYVKMLGADPLSDNPDEVLPADSFAQKALWQRALIVLAGPVFNFILPFFIFFFLFASQAQVAPPVLGTLQPDGVAERAGLRPGDRIVEIDGSPIRGWWELERVVSSNAGQALSVTVSRDGGRQLVVSLTPESVTDVVAPELGLTRTVGRIQIELGYRRPFILVSPGSAAAASGLESWDEIVAIGGAPVDRYESVMTSLESLTAPTTLTVLRRAPLAEPEASWFDLESQQARTITFTPKAGDGLLGLRSAEFAIYDVVPGSPEEKAGLTRGDEIVAIDGAKKSSWGVLMADIRGFPGGERALTVARDGVTRTVKVTFEERTVKGEFNTDDAQVLVGMSHCSGYALPEPIPNDARIAYAISKTGSETARVFGLTLASLTGLFTGQVALKQMGGPIFIYEVASRTREEGWTYFFTVMAWLSISLGLINLVPIPVLDGGHLLLFLLEGLRRKPLSMRTRQIAFYIGFSFIAVLMVLVFRNDIMRSFN